MPIDGVVLVLGLAAGVALRTWLATADYRIADESDVPSRHTWWIVPATGLLGLVLWVGVRQVESIPVATVFVISSWVMIALAFIDLDVHRLPDKIQLPSYPILLALLVICAATDPDWPALGRAIIAGAVLFAFYFLLLLLPSGFGFGDVKLAGLLGLLLGWLGWSYVLRATFATFVIGGLVAVGLMLRKGSGRKDEFAYGPSMLAGAVVAIVLPALLS